MARAGQVDQEPESTPIRRVAAASLIGTTIEWYDFYIYGAASATVVGALFFPGFSTLAGTLAAFSTFAVGFVARPSVARSSAISVTGSAARRC